MARAMVHRAALTHGKAMNERNLSAMESMRRVLQPSVQPLRELANNEEIEYLFASLWRIY